MSSIIIGRSPYGEQIQRINDMSVSRRHAKLTQLSKDRWKLEDIGSTYGTYVDGLPTVSSEIGKDTPIVLGTGFCTTVRELYGEAPLKTMPGGSPGQSESEVEEEVISIKKLEQIHKDYTQRVKKIAKSKLKTQLFRMAPMQLMFPVIGICGMLIADYDLRITVTLSGTVFVILMTVIMTLRVFHVSKRQVRKQFEFDREFQMNYVCPSCKVFYGTMRPYRALLKQGKCPYCNKVYLESKLNHVHR